jgi:pimeloyl-ACP methyl ester carboxylesterase
MGRSCSIARNSVMRYARVAGLSIYLPALLVPATVFAQSELTGISTLRSSGYAPVNGLRIYYEVHGAGAPLVLLHGGYMTIDLNWSKPIPQLAKSRRVIALEMQGHGRTADSERPFSYGALADDVAAVLKHLGIAKADVLGYSLGGTVALETAIRHPALVQTVIFISSVFRYDGWVKEARDLFPTLSSEFFEKTLLKTEYDRLAPDRAHWSAFVTKLAKFDATPFDLGAENIRALMCPVLIVKGDNDGVELTHIAEMYELLGGDRMGDTAGLPRSRLAVLPSMTHVGLMEDTERLASLINAFLDATR